MPAPRQGTDAVTEGVEWRLHCEARHLLRLGGYRCIDAHGRWVQIGPRQHRQQYLQRVQAARGRAERERLADAALRIWEATAPALPDQDYSG